jgi:hypothetical protein
VPGLGQPCANTSSTNVCVANSTWQCVDSERECEPGQAEPNETCDGRDNNCNDLIDEGFNFQNDENHCGGCNIRCGTGLTCCGGTCVNTDFSNTHCGGCGDACTSGFSCCDGNCFNTEIDPNHCGSCDGDCSILLPIIQTKCDNGTCKGLLGG